MRSTVFHPIGTTRASRSMAGATIRVGGRPAGGIFAGSGVGEGRIGGAEVIAGAAVRAASGSHSGRIAAVGFASVGRPGVGLGVSVREGRRAGAVSANTTAPASVMECVREQGARDQMLLPRPDTSSSPPTTSMARDSADDCFPKCRSVLPDSLYLSSQCLHFRLDVLVAAVYLLDVVDHALASGAQGGDQ